VSGDRDSWLLELTDVDAARNGEFRARRVKINGKQDESKVILPRPQTIALGTAGQHLIEEVRWYLEKYLEGAYGGHIMRAERVLCGLRSWACSLRHELAGARIDLEGDETEAETIRIVVKSEDHRVLAWPWEALGLCGKMSFDTRYRFERRMAGLGYEPQPTESTPAVLLAVIARPYERDVGYRQVFYPVLERIRRMSRASEVRVIRPPTLAQLERELARAHGKTVFLHFDGHGVSGEAGNTAQLFFEDERGNAHGVDSSVLGQMLFQHGVGCAVLGACRSAAVGDTEEPAASVASSLLQAGVPRVVAMSHSLYANAAASFMPAFYEVLFRNGALGEATHAGRLALAENPYRAQDATLADWLVPVLYLHSGVACQDDSIGSSSATSLSQHDPTELEVQLIGRHEEMLSLERNLLQSVPVTLIHGLPGSGKSALVRAFVAWLTATGTDRRPIVWNSGNIGQLIRDLRYRLLGERQSLLERLFRRPHSPRSIRALLRALARQPALVVIDELDSVSEEDRHILLRSLRILKARESKFILVCDNSAPWLDAAVCIRIAIRQMAQEDLARLAGALFSRTQQREHEELSSDPGLSVISATSYEMRAGGVAEEEITKALRALLFRLPDDIDELRYPILALHGKFIIPELLLAMCAHAKFPISSQRLSTALMKLESAGAVSRLDPNVLERRNLQWVGQNSPHNIPDDRKHAWERAFAVIHGDITKEMIGRPLQGPEVVGLFLENIILARSYAESRDERDSYDILSVFLFHHSKSRGRYDEMLSYAQEYVAWCRAHGRTDAVGQLAVAEAFRCLEEPQAALDVLMALRHEDLAEDQELRTNFLFEMGCLKRDVGDLAGALANFELVRESDAEASTVTSSAWLATANVEAKIDTEKAQTSLDRAMKGFKAAGDDAGCVKTLIRMAELAAQVGQTDTAIELLSQATDMNDESNVRVSAVCADNLAKLAFGEGRFKDVEGWAHWLLQLGRGNPRERSSMELYAASHFFSVARARSDIDLANAWLQYLQLHNERG
jgi:tetratricopeptide (TPR) repeat protein